MPLEKQQQSIVGAHNSVNDAESSNLVLINRGFFYIIFYLDQYLNEKNSNERKLEYVTDFFYFLYTAY